MPKTFKNKKFHFLYKTTNLINGRYYFGMHSTNNLEDGYVGSGTLLRRALVKYGKENFKMEILKFYNSREELSKAENDLITETELAKKSCMNLKPGGTGGFSSAKHKEHFLKAGKENRKKACIKHLERLKSDPEYRTAWSRKRRETQSRHGFAEGTFKGRHHTEATKKLMREKAQGRHAGSSNSQFGTCWITNGIESKKIFKGSDIPEGWNLGRKIKFRSHERDTS